ncbi:uncharacterized protein J3R85_009486 [Psidium guajava]|nr:uncharacterized protein J3R85_009486 [Psidium guajava]
MLTASHFSERDGIGTDLTAQAFSAMVNLRSLVCLCCGSCKRKDACESTLESVKAKTKETTLKPRLITLMPIKVVRIPAAVMQEMVEW